MKVKGPIGAVVATLYSAGWKPEKPDKWQDPEGDTWAIDYDSPEVTGDIQEAIDQHYDKKMLEKTAKHHCGSGLQQGGDFTVVRKHLRHWRQRGEHRKAATLEMIAQGAAWPKARQKEAGYTCDAKCHLCDGEHELNDLHQFWTCEEVRDLQPPEVQETNNLMAQAVHDSEDLACFWLRGITPAFWTTDRLLEAAPPTEDRKGEGPLSCEGKWKLPAGATAAPTALVANRAPTRVRGA